MLVLRPRGVPLPNWIAARVDAAEAAAAAAGGDAASAAAATRLACATPAMLRVLYALDVVHAAGWVHCDVRPSNVVVVENAAGARALLIDWGSASRTGERGIEKRWATPFSHAGVFDQAGPDWAQY